MSKEAAAAILTQVYFESLTNERARLTGRSPKEPYAVSSLEKIGTIYGIFLSKMDAFELWGKDRTK